MNRTEPIITELKPIWKGVGYLGLLFLAGVSVYMIYLVGSRPDPDLESKLASVFFAFLLVGTAVGAVYFYKSRVLINADGMTMEGLFGSYTIAYANIERIKFDNTFVMIYGENHSVSIGTMESNFEEAARFINEKIEGREDIKIEGKNSLFEITAG